MPPSHSLEVINRVLLEFAGQIAGGKWRTDTRRIKGCEGYSLKLATTQQRTHVQVTLQANNPALVDFVKGLLELNYTVVDHGENASASNTLDYTIIM